MRWANCLGSSSWGMKVETSSWGEGGEGGRGLGNRSRCSGSTELSSVPPFLVCLTNTAVLAPTLGIMDRGGRRGVQTSVFNNRNYFLTLLEVSSLRADCGQGWSFRVLSPCLVHCVFLPVASHALSSVHACVLISSPSKHTSRIGLGSTLITSFYLNYL